MKIREAIEIYKREHNFNKDYSMKQPEHGDRPVLQKLKTNETAQNRLCVRDLYYALLTYRRIIDLRTVENSVSARHCGWHIWAKRAVTLMLQC